MNTTLIAQVTNTAGEMAQAAAKKQAADGQSAKATDGKATDAKGADGKSVDAKGEAPAGAEAAPTAAAATPWYWEMLDSGAMHYMLEGGIFMWPILLLGILAAGVMIERFRSLLMLGADTEALRAKVLELLNADRVEEALELCDSQQGPVPAILSTGLRKFLVLRRLNYDAGRIEEQVIKSMDDYGVHIVAALERHLPILATVASAAPMIGFLGTVQGMVISFDYIASHMGEASIVLLAAAGIKVALLTTVLGLIVGIPAFMAYNYFNSVINRFVLDVEESATDLIEAVTMQMAINAQSAAAAPAAVDQGAVAPA
jgi:biopolymer transport protein ExbB